MMAPITLKALKQTHLWAHQVRAVDLVARYITARESGAATGSALIRLPTGTGKTGVIAVAARLLAAPGIVVVVCPSEALRQQLCDEIRERFWEKLGVQPPTTSLRVEIFFPKDIEQRLKEVQNENRAVLVGTAQSLTEIYRTRRPIFAALKKRASLLVFDEGHREPARRWGEAARALECPSVLFSATPYRNDYALFNIQPQFVESLSFHDALKDRCIRDVSVLQRKLGKPEAVALVLNKLLNSAPADARAIVRCATRDSIVQVANALNSTGTATIGIHERFRVGDGTHLRHDVPNPATEPARVWVHQNKLLEGIDDPRFRIVAIYEPFANARSLVQQIGRVIRNPSRKTADPAIVVVDPTSGQQEFWERYLDFENAFDPRRHDVRDLIQQAITSQPEFRYLDRTFRRKFSPTAKDFYDRLRVPRAANIYAAPDKWDPNALCDEVIAEWEDGERVFLNKAVLNKSTVLVLYADARNSPVLLRDYFIEDRLGFTLVHRERDWVFYHDTGGALCEALRGICAELDPSQMQALFGKKARAVSASMRNTDLGRHAFRRRTVHAYSLEEAATGLSDHGYFCSTAEGYDAAADGSSIRRYVGIARSRLTETCPPNHGLNEFLQWASRAAAVLDTTRTKGTINTLFSRFAAPTAPPLDTTPAHLLLDITDLVERGGYRTVNGGSELEIEDLAVPVSANRSTIVANGTPYEVSVKYDKGRYSLDSPAFDNAYLLSDASDRFRRGIVAHANLEQAFRVVPAGGWKIYAHGHFVAPSIQVGKNGNGPDITRLLTEVPALATTTSEKGKPATATKKAGWDADSVFGVFDRCVRRRAPKNADRLDAATTCMDVVVCDDMNSEAADFFCADTKNERVILVHAKWKGSGLSATALHDVCSQAVKNLDILQPFACRTPPNLKHWDEDWSANYGKAGPIGSVARIRCGPNTGKECWEKISALIGRPNTTREVWIVLGRTLRIASLRAEQNKSKPEPEAVQIFYQLQSTWTAVSAIGARLRVFAS